MDENGLITKELVRLNYQRPMFLSHRKQLTSFEGKSAYQFLYDRKIESKWISSRFHLEYLKNCYEFLLVAFITLLNREKNNLKLTTSLQTF